jgi:8-oxo-dGTP pyrophosphatase MutT (NUDIX family)
LLYLLNRLRLYVTRPITVGVRLILTDGQSVLLVKHTYQRHWYLPGGGVQKSETLEQAARREMAEEVGAQLGQLQLFGVYTNFYEYKNDHVIVFVCDDFTLADEMGHEIERIGFFDLDDLPDGVSPGSERRIREYTSGDDLPIVGDW